MAPWIAFWGWVALDSALVYRKSQAALEQTDESQVEGPDEAAAEPRSHPWTLWSPGARLAMISAPVIALLGPLLLDRLTRLRKP